LAERLASSALSDADALPHDSDRALAYAFLAQQIQSWGGTDRAERLAALSLKDASASDEVSCRVRILTRALPLLTKILDRPKLLNLARLAESTLAAARADHQMSHDYQLRLLLGATASAWYAAGDADRAVAVASSTADEFVRESAVFAVIQAAAAAGDLDRARAIADSLPSPMGRDRALGRIVATLTGDDDDEHIADLVNAILDRSVYAAALTDWGYRAAKRGDVDAAINLARRAEAIGRSIGDPVAIASLLTPLASVLVATGDTERARAIARRATAAYRSIPEQLRLTSALATLVQVTADAGDDETAVDAARLIKDPHARARAQAHLASIARRDKRDLAVGLVDEAEATAMLIPVQRQRLEAQGAVMTALWIIGEDERAEALARSVTERDQAREPLQPVGPSDLPSSSRPSTEGMESLAAEERDRALTKAVDAVAAAGDFARAEALVGLIGQSWQRTAARISVVVALARAGQHDRAHALARSDGDPSSRRRCLRELADVLADQSAFERAEEVARSIEDDFNRGTALIALARKVDPARAGALLLVPIMHGRLPETVDLLAAVCPEAIEVLTDHLLSEEGQHQVDGARVACEY
jgi:tetratricopeptide (TPR) repeat protein